jgi:hypothetical protein
MPIEKPFLEHEESFVSVADDKCLIREKATVEEKMDVISLEQ